MLATLVDAPFDDPEWVFETKWDGFRVVAKIDHGAVLLLSRNGKNVTETYPRIAEALAKMPHRAVLDGELVALDKRGRSRFQLLQGAQKAGARLRYCVFDLMFLDGKDLRRLPLLERKRMLRRILTGGALIHFSRHVKGTGIQAFRSAERNGLEGVIAKRADGPYCSGKRTREWLKIKTTKRQEAVIVGFTRPQGSRKYFGALALAVRRGKTWRYAGRTGTGFDASSLKAIYARLKRLVRARTPVIGEVPIAHSMIWVKPQLVCEVEFTEWTKDGRMRHPAFVGLRNDKPATQVVRERPRRAMRR